MSADGIFLHDQVIFSNGFDLYDAGVIFFTSEVFRRVGSSGELPR